MFVRSLCVLACSSFIAYAKATPPTLKIAGYTSVGAASGKQTNRDNNKGGSATHIQMNASDLGFTVAGISDSGFEYQYRVVIESIPGASAYVSKNYVQFGGDFGTIQVGALKGPEDTMTFSALNLVGGAGSIDGAFPNVYNMSEGVMDGVNVSGHSGKANKLVWYSPIVNGIQLGVGFTPETTTWGRKEKGGNNYAGKGNVGDIYPSAGSNSPRGRNNVVLGAKYNAENGAWNYGVAGVWLRERTYMFAKDTTYKIKVKPVNAYSLSAFLGWNNWKMAAGWMDNGTSRLPRDVNTTYSADGGVVNLEDSNRGNAGKAWNVGGQYITGPYEMAVTYFNSERKTNAKYKAKSDVVSLNLDYQALQGLKFFGEVDFITSKTNDLAKDIARQANKAPYKPVGNNSGTVFVAGTKISF